MFAKNTCIVFIIAGLLVAGTTFTLLYFWGDMQKKTPVRAKQVFLLEENCLPLICQYKKQVNV